MMHSEEATARVLRKIAANEGVALGRRVAADYPFTTYLGFICFTMNGELISQFNMANYVPPRSLGMRYPRARSYIPTIFEGPITSALRDGGDNRSLTVVRARGFASSRRSPYPCSFFVHHHPSTRCTTASLHRPIIAHAVAVR